MSEVPLARTLGHLGPEIDEEPDHLPQLPELWAAQLLVPMHGGVQGEPAVAINLAHSPRREFRQNPNHGKG